MDTQDTDCVRLRPGMYLGPTDTRGLNQCIYLLVDAMLDDFLDGKFTRIDVTLRKDGSCSIWNDGPGISVEIDPATNLPALEAYFTSFTFHQNSADRSRIMRVSCWGGPVAVNAVCERFSVAVTQNGRSHRMAFAKGELVEPLTSKPAPEEVRSMELEFTPDASIFNFSRNFSSGWLSSELSAIATFFPGLEFNLTGEGYDELEAPFQQRIHYPAGPKDYVAELCEDRICFFEEPMAFSGEWPLIYKYEAGETKGMMKVQGAFELCGAYNQGEVLSFVNGRETSEGGSHVRGMQFALVRAIRDLVENAKPEEYRDLIISEEDCIGGLVAVVSVEEPCPSFLGGSKNQFISGIAEGIVNKVVSERLRDWLREDPGIAERIVDRALESALHQRGQPPQPATVRRRRRGYFLKRHERLGNLILAEHHGNGQLISYPRITEAIARSPQFATARDSGRMYPKIKFTGANGKCICLEWEKFMLRVATECSRDELEELVKTLNELDGAM